MTNQDVAAALDEIGVLLQLQGENDFRTKAYANAARTMEQLGQDVNRLVAEKKLGTIRGIGDALVGKITTLVTTGKLPYLEELRASIAPGLLDLIKINGVGPKKVKALHDALGVNSIETLKAACESGAVAGLKGFGEKSAAKILDGIRFLGIAGNRVRFSSAEPLGLSLLEELKKLPGVIRAELCGSLRRKRETVKDIDIVVSSADAGPIMAAFVALPQVIQVLGHGDTKSSVVASYARPDREPIVLNADLRVVTDEQFPVAVLHFTGSKEHNIRLRQRAIERGLSLNEYALTNDGVPIPMKTEAEIYDELDLPFIPPECREDHGEIELAEAGPFPALVTVDQIKGVFHNHTTESDGTATLEEMALAAKAQGFEYFGVADHSQSLVVANGLSPERVRAQWAEVDRLNAKLTGIHILKGTECDILADGRLDYDDELLAGFDYVVAAVHTLFGLPEAEQTARICKALEHPLVTMLAHPTGRLLLRREGYKVNLEAVLATAAKHKKLIEINAQPDRLDLDWTFVRRAKQLGVMLVVNTDAHDLRAVGYAKYGINVARRGLLTAAEVFNTRGLAEVLQTLRAAKT